MTYENSNQLKPNNLTRCLITKPKIVGIPRASILAVGTQKLKSLLPQARAVAFNSCHLQNSQPKTKTSTDKEVSSRTNQIAGFDTGKGRSPEKFTE